MHVVCCIRRFQSFVDCGISVVRLSSKLMLSRLALSTGRHLDIRLDEVYKQNEIARLDR